MSEPDRSRTHPDDDRDSDRDSLASLSRRTLLGAGATVAGLFGLERFASDGVRAAGSDPDPGPGVGPSGGTGADVAPVAYAAVESPTPRVQFSEVSRLDGGRAVVDLPDHFERLVDDGADLIVQVTPYGGGGLRVTERSLDGVVVEDVGGDGDHEFAITVTGTRAGVEGRPAGRERGAVPDPGGGAPPREEPAAPDPRPSRESGERSPGPSQPADPHDAGEVPEPSSPVRPPEPESQPDDR